jgi:hypothetical protein
LDFVRWVVPIKARGRYTLCSAIHRAEGVRRVRNGDFWKSELFTKDLPSGRNKKGVPGKLPWQFEPAVGRRGSPAARRRR